jgi:spore coat protein U-like protein
MCVGGCPLAALAGCNLNVIGLNFGEYDIFSVQDTNITTTLGVSCDVDTPFEISLSAGSGTFATRTLTSGANLLNYNLFLDPTHLTIWGDGSPGTSTLSTTGTGGNYTVYGRIPAHQNAAVGSYADTITVTITF